MGKGPGVFEVFIEPGFDANSDRISVEERHEETDHAFPFAAEEIAGDHVADDGNVRDDHVAIPLVLLDDNVAGSQEKSCLLAAIAGDFGRF